MLTFDETMNWLMRKSEHFQFFNTIKWPIGDLANCSSLEMTLRMIKRQHAIRGLAFGRWLSVCGVFWKYLLLFTFLLSVFVQLQFSWLEHFWKDVYVMKFEKYEISDCFFSIHSLWWCWRFGQRSHIHTYIHESISQNCECATVRAVKLHRWIGYVGTSTWQLNAF